ncbi:MAG TPA: UDP binding domain-containing protein, partial [Candidatus Cloacimonas sp.]|nr:UDP binding domain-containing protein [Candidatus Cloacimonas sp.]
ASELAKTMENSYRAVNIAFTLEWAKFAEQIGVDIFKVRDAIRKRKGTHDNLLRPSLGVGGYCLTKDPVLANWAMKSLFGVEGSLNFAIKAVNTNDTMPLHTIEIVKSIYPELKNLQIAVLGVSYLEDVGDTRHSPSKTLVEFLRKDLAQVKTHDPYVEAWPEMEENHIQNDLNNVLPESDVVIFAVGHSQYRKLDPEYVVSLCNTKPLIVDCSNFLSDETIKIYKELGCQVRGVGKGHIISDK